MAKYAITDTLLNNLADSISIKTGEPTPMTLAEMKTAVDDLTFPTLQASKAYTVSASGSTTISPDSNYDAMEEVALTVPSGTATTPASISGTSASVSTGTNTLTLSKTVSVTPNVSTAGYISSGTAGNSSVSLTADVNIQSGMLSSYAPSTTAQTISANTYLPNTVTFLPVTTTNLIADNIKKGTNVKVGYSANAGYIANITGTYEGSGSTTTLKMGVVRPDAELVQTWSGDYFVNSDKGVTIPTYSTTSTTLVAAAAQTTNPTLTTASYRYYILERFLTIPQYSISTKGAGRQEYHWSSYCYEVVYLPASSVQALVDTTKYTSRNNVVFAAGGQIRQLYWSSATALSLYTSTSYGVAQVVTAPTVSSGTSASPTITVTAPSCTIRGSSTYLSQTYYNAITDIRCQYIIELYRVPLSTTSTYGIDGWGLYSQTRHTLDCAISSTHKLT